MSYFVFFVGLLAFVPSIRSQSGCGCQTNVWNRQFCRASPFARGQVACERAGCCYNPSILSIGPRCYSKDLSQCQNQNPPSAPIGGVPDTCVAATPLQSCIYGADRQNCVRNGCCYNPQMSPYCFRAISLGGGQQPVTTEWGQWSSCSSLCSTGTMTRTRSCLLPDSSACNLRGIDLTETSICNVELCSQWALWTNSQCSVTCGSGTYTSTRRCLGFGSLGPSSCHSVTAQCTFSPCPAPVRPVFRPPSVAWSQWEPWQICSNACGPGKRARTRQCKLGGTTVAVDRCRIVNGVSSFETEPCNVNLCSSWTRWISPTGCPVTCGSFATRLATRECKDSLKRGADATIIRSCSRRREPCVLSPCPVTDKANFRTTVRPPRERQTVTTTGPTWIFTVSIPNPTAAPFQTPSSTEGSIFSISWTSQSRRPTAGGSQLTSSANLSPNITVTNTPVSRTSTSTVRGSGRGGSEVTSASSVATTVDLDEFKTTTPAFGATAVSGVTITPISTDPGDSNVVNDLTPSWQPWAAWTTCSKDCGGGFRVRARICTFGNGTVATSASFCGNDAIDAAQCNTDPCIASSSTAEVITTTSTTPETTTTTTTTAAPIVTTRSTTTTETPRVEVLAQWENWEAWSVCSSTCSPGLRIRSRVCKDIASGEELDPKECDRADPGSMFDESSCNTDLCPMWTQWKSTGCSVTCNRGPNEPPGVVLKRRRCEGTETKIAASTCYLISDLCNATKPCPVPTTTSTTTTTTTTVSTTTSTIATTMSTIATTKSPEPTESSGNIWAQWGEWTPCSSPCAPGIQNRVRQCLPGVPEQLCVEGGFSSRECNREYCTGWSAWRTTPCDKTCGDGATKLRRRICLSGQSTDAMPESCHQESQPCEEITACKRSEDGGGLYPKLDVLFLVDSSTHVDDCDSIVDETGLSPPLRAHQLPNTIAPTYARIKKFLTDFSNAWQGISNNGTRVGIQLISGLCNGRTRANLYVEKRYNETHEFLKEYIAEMPYLCGDFWLDWAMQCSYTPIMSERFGDRENIPNIVVAIISDVPTASLPRDSLLRRVTKRLRTKATILSATATRTTQMGADARKQYMENTRKLSCDGDEDCPRFLGSIWDLESSAVATKIRDALK